MLARCWRGCTLPTGGSVKLDGNDFFQLPEYVLGARTAYVGQETYLFPLSVRDNLLFGLKNRPITPASYDEATRAPCAKLLEGSGARRQSGVRPQRRLGRLRAGRAPPARATCCRRMVEALKQVELDEDIYPLGLRGTIDPARGPTSPRRS